MGVAMESYLESKDREPDVVYASLNTTPSIALVEMLSGEAPMVFVPLKSFDADRRNSVWVHDCPQAVCECSGLRYTYRELELMNTPMFARHKYTVEDNAKTGERWFLDHIAHVKTEDGRWINALSGNYGDWDTAKTRRRCGS